MGLFGSTDPFVNLRLSAIERKLDRILNQLGIDDETDVTEPMRELVLQGKKTEAIKLYRETTGAGLAEAKAAIDQLS